MTPWEVQPQWCEADLYFDFSQARQVIKLDDHVAEAGLTHLLKGGVDFVVEWETQLWLLEVKDPENGAIPQQHRERQRRRFLEEMQSDGLIEEHLFPKLRDSLIFLGLEKGIVDKPMRYITLIGLSELDPAQLAGLRDKLWRTEWVAGPRGRSWEKSFDVLALNIGQWNRLLTHCPIQRISQPEVK
ncbi:hypothetical protein [Halomonas llamarensis]|uniref:Uncharacterized protein n=1 Tax=Halomonas llamarensis TaxID=2945104 RepID=A0ABT0SKT7_9GAMM|nr:hypothetical protein [Halomonas llamarensis]MCL7928409.1 hypothetical protein [Halomonas llamarensis]